MSRPATQAPTITIGTRLTDFGALDLTVEGLSTTGGMGLVVWGKDAASGNQMEALKLLKPERLAAARSLQHRREMERQFEDEALVWCHVWHHPCVVTTYGLTRLPALGNLPVLELAYAPNGSLRDRLRVGRVQRTHPALRPALAWVVHIASALAHIHQPDPDHDRPAPLVHCDLKPENVLLDEHGWAQLTDLGLTRAYATLAADPGEPPTSTTTASPAGLGLTPHQAEVARLRAVLQAAGALPGDTTAGSATASAADPSVTLLATSTLRIPPVPAAVPATQAMPMTAPGEGGAAAVSAAARAAIGSRGPVAGTPQYMAPEQWAGINATVPATDLYAFGVMLFELFAGTESPHPFPHDPTPYLTAELYAHALATGYDPGLLAWHAAHVAPSGPARRLTDPEVAEVALRFGPLTELVAGGDATDRRAADAALMQLDALIMACLSLDPSARPTAAAVQQQLATLALDTCGLEPVQSPVPLPAVPQYEVNFWGNLGRTYSNLDRQEEAIAAKRRGIQHDPANPKSWNNLGSSLFRLGDQEHHMAADAAADGQPEAVVSAHSTAARQHFEEALDAFQQAERYLTPQAVAESSSLPAMVASNQAGALTGLGRYASAVVAYQRVLALQPDALDARFGLALAYARWSQEQALDVTPAERLARLRAAQAEIQMVLAAAPDFAQAHTLAVHIARAIADPAHRFV